MADHRVLRVDMRNTAVREGNWSEAIAVGSLRFVHIMKRELGFKAAHREVMELEGSYALRQEGEAYGRVRARYPRH